MPFSIRPHRRFSICYPVTYYAGLREGRGIVWNISMNGWRLSGDVPLCVGQTYSLTVTLPNQPNLCVASVIVRWNRGQEYGLETVVVDQPTQSRVEYMLKHLEQGDLERIE